jgi:cytochrome c oxidase cbb3-type subunit 3
MSDFINEFWSMYVIVITVVGVLACVLLLWFSSSIKVSSVDDGTTGHVWDGDLRELNNPLPRWWMWLFVITIVFSIFYLAMYPGLGKFSGQLAWSSVGQHTAEVAKAEKELAPMYQKYLDMPPEQVAKDPQAMAIGERLFMNNCAQCHGSDARGSKGFPNLTDKDWLYGGTPDKILETLINGRNGNMPPMGAAVGGADEVRNLANYVLSLSNAPHDSVRAGLGKSKFVACAACHGQDGKGNQTIGAPNLTDDIWLHGFGENTIVAMVNGGKNNVMPSQRAKFNDGQLKVLSSYVWSLSQKTAQ